MAKSRLARRALTSPLGLPLPPHVVGLTRPPEVRLSACGLDGDGDGEPCAGGYTLRQLRQRLQPHGNDAGGVDDDRWRDAASHRTLSSSS